MPKIFEICGYIISIWSNENSEPVHVHISKRRPSANSTKVWLLSDGTITLANNNSRIPDRELRKIMMVIQSNYTEILNFWAAYHGYISFYA